MCDGSALQFLFNTFTSIKHRARAETKQSGVRRKPGVRVALARPNLSDQLATLSEWIEFFAPRAAHAPFAPNPAGKLYLILHQAVLVLPRAVHQARAARGTPIAYIQVDSRIRPNLISNQDKKTAKRSGALCDHFNPCEPRAVGQLRPESKKAEGDEMTTQAIKAVTMLILIITVAFFTAVVTANS
jgi:hypothetical protein